MKFDFESIYRIYPRKEGKMMGFKALTKLVKSQAAFDRLSVGVRGYALLIKKEERDKQFVLMFSTFCNQERWEDYCDSEPSAVEEKVWFK